MQTLVQSLGVLITQMITQIVAAIFLLAAALAASTSSCSLSSSGSAIGSGAGSADQIRLLFMIAEDSSSVDSEEVSRAVQLASDHVNSRYCDRIQFTVELEHIQCDRQQALDVFHSYLLDARPLAAIIGAGCSSASEAVAEVSQYYNLSMISFSSSSISLDDRERYPYFTRVVPSDELVAAGMSALISRYDWTRALVLTQDSKSFRLLSDELTEKLEANNITVIANILVPRDLSRVTSGNIFPPDVRIVALNMDSTTARHVLCEASLTLQYKYVWLIQGWYEDHWWEGEEGGEGEEGAFVNCTGRQILEFLHQQRALAVNHFPHGFDRSAVRDGGLSTEEGDGSDFTYTTSYLAYDSVWALAHAMVGLDADVGSYVPLSVDSSVNRGLGDSVRDAIADISFQGVTGPVNLSGGTRIVSTIQILQYNNKTAMTPVEVGTLYTQDDTEIVGVVISDEEVWPNGEIPQDGTPRTEQRYPYLLMVIISNVFAVATILVAVVCLIFTVLFRNRKLIKLSSPNLNCIIAVGVIVFCSSVFLFAYPLLPLDANNAFCGVSGRVFTLIWGVGGALSYEYARTWTVAIGYTLCFGTINTKMWRVYYIFHNPKPSGQKKPLKDVHLVMFVLLFLIVDLVILTIGTALDGVRPLAYQVPDEEHGPELDADGISVSYVVVLCESRWKSLWLGMVFGYKIIIQAIGVLLAFKIRKVEIKVLNDSKEIVATLYLSSLILLIVMVITLAFGDHLNVHTAGYTLGIPLSSSVVLGVVFISKMIRLYKDPKGDNLFPHVTHDSGITGVSAMQATQDDNQIHFLQKRVKQLEAQLTNSKNEVPLVELKPEDARFPVTASNSNGQHVQIILTRTAEESSS